MMEIMEKITAGNGTMEDLEMLKVLGKHIVTNSLCQLGMTAPNPVMSTLAYFWDEYVEHVVNKTCPAKACKDLLTYEVVAGKCKGCTLCKKVCPTDAITGALKEPHVIDKVKCIKCDACVEKCKFGAIVKV